MGRLKDYRDRVRAEATKAGYQQKGMRAAIRRQLRLWSDEEWAGYITTVDYEGEARHELDEPPVYVTPSAWRRCLEKDEHGREWVIFECLEPAGSILDQEKKRRYGELWFDFDARDELIGLRLRRMDEYGQIYDMDSLSGMFYENC